LAVSRRFGSYSPYNFREERQEKGKNWRKLGKMMKRWKEDKIEEQERGRGNGI